MVESHAVPQALDDILDLGVVVVGSSSRVSPSPSVTKA